MHFTSYFVATLLTCAPAVLAKDCTHYEVWYQVPCPNSKCKGGKLEDYAYAFRVNENEFEHWASQAGNGGQCGGFCQRVSRVDKGAAGYTFQMRCVAARMHRSWATGIPGYKEGLERIGENRACDVSCSPNDGPFVGEGCGFKFGKC